MHVYPSGHCLGRDNSQVRALCAHCHHPPNRSWQAGTADKEAERKRALISYRNKALQGAAFPSKQEFEAEMSSELKVGVENQQHTVNSHF